MRKLGTTSVRILKVLGVVTLVVVIGVGLGLHTASVLFCSDNNSHCEWCADVRLKYQQFTDVLFLSDAKLTDILVVVFTYFLVMVGRGQRTIMATQATIAERQTGILNRQLLSQGSLLVYDVYKLVIETENQEGNTLRDYKITLQWRNSGKDIATNVTYWVGSSVVDMNSGEAIAQQQENEKEFREKIFQATTLSGFMAVAPDRTVETDQIVLLRPHLRALYRKKIRFFVWCVMGYRSRLQSEGWFEEVAIYLEFVVDRDPESYGLTVKGIDPGPFRVRIAGYRYRTVEDRSPA